LPASFSTIYEIALLSDEQFGHARDAEIIHPKVRRAEIVALRKASDGGGKEEDQKPPSQPLATEIKAGCRYELKIPENAKEDDYKRITQALGRLCVKFKVEIGPIEESGTVPAKAPISAPPSRTLGSPVNQNSKKTDGILESHLRREKMTRNERRHEMMADLVPGDFQTWQQAATRIRSPLPPAGSATDTHGRKPSRRPASR
jgi:hypothetical protein